MNESFLKFFTVFIFIFVHSIVSKAEEQNINENEINKAYTIYFLGTDIKAADHSHPQYWAGETVSSIAKKQLGKQYFDYLLIDGLGIDNESDHFLSCSSTYWRSLQYLGFGIEGKIECAMRVLKYLNYLSRVSGKNLRTRVSDKNAEIIEYHEIKVINVIGFSRGAFTAIKFANKLHEDPMFKDISVNIFAIDPVSGGPFVEKFAILTPNVKKFTGIYARDELSMGYEPSIPILEDGNNITKISLFTLPGKHGSLSGDGYENEFLGAHAGWTLFTQYLDDISKIQDLASENKISLRDDINIEKFFFYQSGLLVRHMGEQFLMKHGTQLDMNSTLNLNKDFFIDLYNSMVKDVVKYKELGSLKTYTTNFFNTERQAYLTERKAHVAVNNEDMLNYLSNFLQTFSEISLFANLVAYSMTETYSSYRTYLEDLVPFDENKTLSFLLSEYYDVEC